MTPQESRERFLNSLFTMDEVLFLEKMGLAEDYIEGRISINTIYNYLKDQGV